MLVYAVAAVQLLVYLWAIPIHLAIRVDGGGGLRFGAGLSAFDRRAAGLRAARRLSQHDRQSNADFGRILRIIRRLTVNRLILEGRLGTGDAALTALACGALTALARGVGTRAARCRVAVKPEFPAERPAIALRVAVSFRAGPLVRALLLAGFDDIKGSV